MKKPILILLSATLLLSTSCQNALEPEATTTPDKGQTEKLKRSAEDAIAWAIDFKNAQPGVKSRAAATAYLADVKIISSNASRANADTLIYAVNYANNEGYALISASCLVEPVLGYVEEGSFDEESIATNSSYSYFLSEAKEYVSTPKSGGIYEPRPIDRIPVNQIIFPRVQVSWDKHYPEGYFFDNKIAGCIQTATAQIMSYIEQPTSINLTYPGRDKDVESLNWSNLKLHTRSNSADTICNSCSLTHEEHLVLSRLCRQIGYLNNSFPSRYICLEDGTQISTATSVAENNSTKAFEILLPNNIVGNTSVVFDGVNLYNSLYGLNRVAMVVGVGDTGGHAWVCDGGQKIGNLASFTNIDGSIEQRFIGSYYLHYNWGWGGTDNGYFLSTVFDTSDAYSYDNQSSACNDWNFGSHSVWYVIIKK